MRLRLKAKLYYPEEGWTEYDSHLDLVADVIPEPLALGAMAGVEILQTATPGWTHIDAVQVLTLDEVALGERV